MDARDILVKPIITEKTTALMEEENTRSVYRSQQPRSKSVRLLNRFSK